MNEFALSLLLLGALSTNGQLPFWATSGQYGLMPETNGALAWVQAGTQYDTTREFQWKWGVSMAANYDSRCPIRSGMTNEGKSGMTQTADFNLMVDELYGSLKWRALSLDLGMKRFNRDFFGAGTPTLGSLSTTGGNIIWSGNARTMPGYALNLNPVAIPGTGKHVWLYGSWGDYWTIDERYVTGALIHRMDAGLRFDITRRLGLTLGFEHDAMWGGTSPRYGELPTTLSNYLRVIAGQAASAEAPVNDRNNVIGDQRGRQLLRLDWRGDGWQLALQHDHPFEDVSSLFFRNFPDAVNTLALSLDDKDAWVSDFVYEFQYTRYQSGPINESTKEEENKSRSWLERIRYWLSIQDGGDNYFNNWEYKSGWTHFGHPIGNPLFFPEGTRDGSWTSGRVVLGVENNRVRAHHMGVAGKLFRKLPYKLMLTYSENYGIFKERYTGPNPWNKPWGTVEETPLRQVSGAFMGEVPLKLLTVTYGLYADKGVLLPDNFGATVGLRYSFGGKR
ncbi:MAG: hypothetical protein IKX34_09195 [Bacteroidales bacterium]|nr:hypothetical protein [Bacteroidales bacterium]